MISKRAQVFFGEEPPLVKAHFQCKADSYSATNTKGYVNLGTAENHLMDDVLRAWFTSHAGSQIPIHYDAPQGNFELRQAYGHFINHFFQINNMPTKNISISSGASSLIEMLSFVLCNEGDKVLAVGPLYNGFFHDIEARFKVNLVVSDGLSPKGLDLGQIEEDIKKHKNLKVLLLNNPNNPTGWVFTKEELRGIIALAKKYYLEIIADEIYGNSDYFGRSAFVSLLNPCFSDLHYEEHIHHVYGMAKDFCLSGFKVGFFSSYNSAVAHAMAQSCYFHTVSTDTQKQVTALIQDLKWCESFFRTNQQRLAELADFLIPQLQNLGIEVFPAKAGIFLWCKLSNRFEIQSFEQEQKLYTQFFNQGRFNITPGQVFKAAEPGWFRICFAQSKENIAEFVHRLARIEHAIIGRDENHVTE